MRFERPTLSDTEAAWCSNFQTSNPNCPDSVRNWLVSNHRYRFNSIDMRGINLERKRTKSQRRKKKKKLATSPSLEVQEKNKRLNRKRKQNNKKKSTDIRLKESRQKRDLRLAYKSINN